jgi:hypothetical protein
MKNTDALTSGKGIFATRLAAEKNHGPNLKLKTCNGKDQMRILALPLIGLATLLVSTSTFAQQVGPQNVDTTYCLKVVAQTDGTFKFTNTCGFLLEVAAAQVGANGQANGSDTFEIGANDTHFDGTTTLRIRYWACASPSIPIRSSTHASPDSSSFDVICTNHGGHAGAAN